MSGSRFKRKGGGERERRPALAALRPLGRVAIWAVLALLLVRGGAAILSPGPGGEGTAASGGGTEGPGQAVEATAIGFARAWLEDPEPQALSAYLAEGAHLGRGRVPSGAAEVAQAEVIRSTNLGGGRWVLTVSCDLRDARVLYLAVPIVRPQAGEAAVIGAPSIV
ncbi:MAG: hypothetical protein H0X42_12460, partial [Solirubrobacterales bacterium]|nr:hypothetical protein [Solirubrobacterales bacterium]